MVYFIDKHFKFERLYPLIDLERLQQEISMDFDAFKNYQYNVNFTLYIWITLFISIFN